MLTYSVLPSRVTVDTHFQHGSQKAFQGEHHYHDTIKLKCSHSRNNVKINLKTALAKVKCSIHTIRIAITVLRASTQSLTWLSQEYLVSLSQKTNFPYIAP